MLRIKKRYRLINFICLLAGYKKLIGTGRVLGTSILRYACAFLTMLSVEQDSKVAADTILTPMVWRTHDLPLPKRTLPLEQSGR